MVAGSICAERAADRDPAEWRAHWCSERAQRSAQLPTHDVPDVCSDLVAGSICAERAADRDPAEWRAHWCSERANHATEQRLSKRPYV
ncbi:MAG: hypothetical protein GY734_16530 [Herbaspirillum sp.]|nr:hypothetical protein [Herbaspirillum sp.]